MEEIYTLADGTPNETDQEPLSMEAAQIQALSTLADTAGELGRAVSAIAAYVPTQWKDFAPPDITATNLMHIENGIKAATDAVNNAIASITSLNTQVSELNGSKFPYRGKFTGDFNSLNIADGVYQIDNAESYTNGPSAKPTYCTFFQLVTSAYHVQMIVNANHIYTRKYTGNPAHWWDWEEYITASTIAERYIHKGTNKRYCKIVSTNSSYNYGPVFLLCSSCMAAFSVYGNNRNEIFISDKTKVSISQPDSVTTIVDCLNDYQHFIVLMGGSISNASVTFYN